MAEMNGQKSRMILIVEDDPPTYRALADELHRQGFSVIEARDGVAGLASALRNRPDVIILDILMPRMGGFEMLKQLRAENEWGKTVPVIILTVVDPAREDVTESVAELAPTYYIEKSSLQIDDLKEKIMSVLETIKE